jgi:hypothetical protein
MAGNFVICATGFVTSETGCWGFSMLYYFFSASRSTIVKVKNVKKIDNQERSGVECASSYPS